MNENHENVQIWSGWIRGLAHDKLAERSLTQTCKLQARSLLTFSEYVPPVPDGSIVLRDSFSEHWDNGSLPARGHSGERDAMKRSAHQRACHSSEMRFKGKSLDMNEKICFSGQIVILVRYQIYIKIIRHARKITPVHTDTLQLWPYSQYCLVSYCIKGGFTQK